MLLQTKGESYKAVFEHCENEMKTAVPVFEAFSSLLADAFDQLAEDQSETRKMLARLFEDCGVDGAEMNIDCWNDDLVHLLDPGLVKADVAEGIAECSNIGEGVGVQPFEVRKQNLTKEELELDVQGKEAKMNNDQLNAFKSVKVHVEEYMTAQATGTKMVQWEQ